MNTDSIKSILTLRYDYTQTPFLPKLTWQNLEKKQNFSVDELQNHIASNITKQIPTSYSGPISISLSGGIDSSIVLCILKQVFPDNQIDAISIKFSDSVDETETASKIAKKIGVDHHIVEINNFLEKLENVISITKLPFWDVHWIYVVEKAKQFSNYLVSGDGGDELFGGYVFRYAKFLSIINDKSDINDKIKAYISCHERDHVPEQEQIFGTKFQFQWEDIYQKLKPYFDNSLHPLDQVFLADYNGKLLHNFSLVNKKITNHFNLKSVTPLLSNELIHKSMKIPISQKYNSSLNIGKIPLRQLLTKFGIDNLVEKQKLGFSVNTKNLWKNFGFSMVKKYFDNSTTVRDGWINQTWIDSNLTADGIDIRHVNKLLGLLAFEIWYRNIEL